jgi:hypothetical protein
LLKGFSKSSGILKTALLFCPGRATSTGTAQHPEIGFQKIFLFQNFFQKNPGKLFRIIRKNSPAFFPGAGTGQGNHEPGF